MRVKIREVNINKGQADKNGNPYNFAKVKVRCEQNSTCFWVNIDNKVFPTDKIKAGNVYDIYFKSEGSQHVSDVEVIVGERPDGTEAQDTASAPTYATTFQNFDDIVDKSTGEVTDDIPLPEPPAEVLAAHERDKAKQNKNKS